VVLAAEAVVVAVAVVPGLAAVAADSPPRLRVQVLPQPGQVPPRLVQRRLLGPHRRLVQQRVLVLLGVRLALVRQQVMSRGLVLRPVR
jgi:hypothetical protein